MKFNIEAVTSDCIKFIDSTNKKFDIIFADPPYKLINFSELQKMVDKLLKPKGVFCLEMKKQELNSIPDRIKYYGNTQVVFWKQTK